MIDNYDNYKLNVDRNNYLENPHFTLHIVKNRNTYDSIIAQVKWEFPINNKIKKLKYHSIFIGTSKQLGLDIESQSVLDIAKGTIKEYFNEKSLPLPVDYDMLNEYLGLTETFDLIRSKRKEIIARLNPEFYMSKNKTKSNYKAIVANIKWGFPYPGRSGCPRYIPVYIGSEKDITDDVKTDKYKQIIKPKVIEYLKLNSFFDVV
ncbi:MAG: hypothetical protein U0354_21090 [Candidatus Sericytochromatia bacterium]